MKESRVTPTKEEWAEVESRLTHPPFRSVRLRVDGYDLSLQVGQLSAYKLAIVPYINGESKGAWFTNDCEERRRFFCPSQRSAFTRKHKERLIKAVGKRAARKFGVDDTFTVYLPYWTSFSRLRRHLLAHNEHIEVVA